MLFCVLKKYNKCVIINGKAILGERNKMMTYFPQFFLTIHEHHQHGEGFDFFDTALHALIDSEKMLPFLFIAFFLMEFLEHKAGDKLVDFLRKSGGGRTGSAAVGALLGCVPQCGFSVVASNFYAGRIITAGTLIAVFLSTSDEAVPILLAHPDKAGMIWKLLVTKVIIAAVAGIAYAVYKYLEPDYLDDFDADYIYDNFDDDFIEFSDDKPEAED